MAEPPAANRNYVSACVRVGDFEVCYLAAEPPEGVTRRGTVLLLHGFGAWSEVVWSKTMPALAAAGYRVVAPDLLGFGLSAKPDRAYFSVDNPVEPETQFVLAFLDAIGVDRVAVVGNSFGGGLALRLTVVAPERVTRLALVGSMGFGRSIHHFYKAIATPFLGDALVRPDRARLRLMWEILVHDPKIVTDEIVDRNFELLSEPGAAEVLTAARYGVSLVGQRHLFLGALMRVDQPALLVWGRHDRVFPIRHARRALRLLPKGELVVLDCGHLPPVERPDEFNAVLLRFLEGTPDVGPAFEAPAGAIAAEG